MSSELYSSSGGQYFAAQDAKDVARCALAKANSWYVHLDSNGYLVKLRHLWAAYHGAYFTDVSDGHSIVFTGEQGELTTMAVNHLRNLADHIHTMITTNRPTLIARATNTDNKSLIQTYLANGLLEYYLREKRLEDYINIAAKYAIVLGSGFIKMEWSATTGEIYDYNEETGVPIYEGDVVFSNLSPFDVVFDGTKEHQNHDWVICRSFKNKYDLMAKYPELSDEIEKIPTKDKTQMKYYNDFRYDETDDVGVYEFYHKKSEAMPKGRYILFLSDNVVLSDSPLPYRNIPIYRIAPSDILGTPFGYTPMFDILPIQTAINSLYSAILTNQNAFAVQNVWVPRGSDVSISSLSGGLNLVEGNSQYGPPIPLNLTKSSPETFNFIAMLERVSEVISGVSSVSRGNPDPSLKSGTALALVQSMSLQFMSGLQQSYVKLVEDVGTGLLHMLRDFASVPRIAAIVGKSNRCFMKEFSGDDLSMINRVIVDVGNALSQTTAGRVQMAEQLLQMKLFRTPEEYFTVLNTGRLDAATEDTQKELSLIHGENERLIDGEDNIALPFDHHSLHIKEHRTVISDPVLRFNTELTLRVAKHIKEHLDLLSNTDPNLLTIIQEQPLGPPAGSPANQPNTMPPGGSLPTVNPEITNLPPAAPEVAAPGIPAPASPPAPFENLPTNPAKVPLR